MNLKRTDGIRLDKYSHGGKLDYHRFLDNLSRCYEVVPVKDHPVEGKTCYLRHDVDWSIDGALQMAEVEAEHGIKSTYYIRPRSVYMKRATSQIKSIMALGHEIGLHHSVVVEYFRKVARVPLATIFGSGIDKLGRLGVEVKTVSSHGDPECQRGGYSNYEAFEECPSQLRKLGVKMDGVSLSQFGVRAVEFMEHDCFLWDSGGGWKYTYDPYVDDWNGEYMKWNKSDTVMDDIDEIHSEQLMCLTHPVWWTFYE